MLPITQGASFELIETSLGDTVEKFALYDITLKDDDIEVQPDGLLKIKLLIPENFDKRLLKLYHIDEEGEKTEVEFTLEGNYIVFTVDSLSSFLVTQTKGVTNPKTGDGITIAIIYGFISMIGIAVTIGYLKSKEITN